MATKTFNTRLQLKYDTLANWTEHNPKLLLGEIGVCSVPNASETTVGQVAKPAILFKVGDGTTLFNDLPWASGLAADVYAWAKASTKPVYKAEEITVEDAANNFEGANVETVLSELWTEIQNLTGGQGGSGTIASQIAEGIKAIGSKEVEAGHYITKVGIDDNGKLTITTAELPSYTLTTGTTNGTVKFNGAEVTVAGLDSAAYKKVTDFDEAGAAAAVLGSSDDAATKTTVYGAIAKIQAIEDDYLKEADKTALQDNINAKYTKPEDGIGTADLSAEVKASLAKADSALQAADFNELNGKVTTLVGEDANKSVRTISAEEIAKIVAGADESYDTLKEIADWITSHSTDAATMNSAILALQAIVDGIGGEGEEATVVAYVQKAIEALKIGDYAKAADLTELAGRVTSNETAIAAINNETTGILTTAKKYTDEKIGAIKIEELNQTDYVIFNCGSATEVM